MKMATDMKPIAFTMEQLEYVFNFGTTFKFDKDVGGWMEDFENAFGELYDTAECPGTEVIYSEMDEYCLKLMEGAMIEEARKLGDIVKCVAMKGFFPVLENTSLITVSTIINRIHHWAYSLHK